MVEIQPFRGILYNKSKIKDLSQVMAPPYDIISNEDQEKYYNKHQYNVIRLILGKDFPWDGETNNRYTRAARFLRGWLREGILQQDSEPSIYIYDQHYFIKGGKKVRRGFIALAKLDKEIVLPHEKTLSAPREDRLKLMRAVRANLSQIFTLYRDQDDEINRILSPIREKEPPIIEIKDENGFKHKVWRVKEEEIISRIRKEMKDKQIFIADGHHRYETALNYRDELCKNSKGLTPFDYMSMYFTSVEDPGLTILPAHRLIAGSKTLSDEEVVYKLRDFFEIETLEFSSKLEKIEQRRKMFERMEEGSDLHIFGMYLRGSNKYHLLYLRGEEILDEQIREEISPECKRLDVTILHKLILKILGLEGESISYTQSEEQAIQAIEEGEYCAAFFLNPTKVSQVLKIATLQERMPGKATYFYPKLLSGLVIYKF